MTMGWLITIRRWAWNWAKLFSPEKYRERLQDLYAKFK